METSTWSSLLHVTQIQKSLAALSVKLTGWVNFTTVWVHPEHRRKGLASRMLKVAESEAARKGYTQAYLDTFSFQSPDFYLRLGYEVFGKLDNFPAGSTRVFMRKIIRDHGANQIPTNTPGTEENA